MMLVFIFMMKWNISLQMTNACTIRTNIGWYIRSKTLANMWKYVQEDWTLFRTYLMFWRSIMFTYTYINSYYGGRSYVNENVYVDAIHARVLMWWLFWRSNVYFSQTIVFHYLASTCSYLHTKPHTLWFADVSSVLWGAELSMYTWTHAWNYCSRGVTACTVWLTVFLRWRYPDEV